MTAEWTPEDVELAGVAIDEYYRNLGLPEVPRPYAAAEAVLAALAEAGRLRPEGTKGQWSVRVKSSGYVTPLPLSEETAREIAGMPYPAEVEVVRRWTTPWRPVTETRENDHG